MKDISISDEFIKLEQALKLTGEFSVGSDAKYAVKDGKVKVNGETELRRGKKLRPGGSSVRDRGRRRGHWGLCHRHEKRIFPGMVPPFCRGGGGLLCGGPGRSGRFEKTG